MRKRCEGGKKSEKTEICPSFAEKKSSKIKVSHLLPSRVHLHHKDLPGWDVSLLQLELNEREDPTKPVSLLRVCV